MTYLALTLLAAVTVSPPSPRTGDPVTVRLENSFGFQAAVLSASISRTGNTFTIDQDVSAACLLPANPAVISELPVGQLAPGSYVVIANISFTPAPGMPECALPPRTQTVTFDVAPDVPALDPNASALLVIVLALLALRASRL